MCDKINYTKEEKKCEREREGELNEGKGEGEKYLRLLVAGIFRRFLPLFPNKFFDLRKFQ